MRREPVANPMPVKSIKTALVVFVKPRAYAYNIRERERERENERVSEREERVRVTEMRLPMNAGTN